jgi:hypothetical protein
MPSAFVASFQSWRKLQGFRHWLLGGHGRRDMWDALLQGDALPLCSLVVDPATQGKYKQL